MFQLGIETPQVTIADPATARLPVWPRKQLRPVMWNRMSWGTSWQSKR